MDQKKVWRKYSSANVRFVRFDQINDLIREALKDERYEDVQMLEEEKLRRSVRPKSVKLQGLKASYGQRFTRISDGPFYVWMGWERPISHAEVDAGGCKMPSPPYCVFLTLYEATAWLDGGEW